MTHADAITQLRTACGLYLHHADQGDLSVRALKSCGIHPDAALLVTANLLADDIEPMLSHRATPAAKRAHSGVVKALRGLV